MRVTRKLLTFFTIGLLAIGTAALGVIAMTDEAPTNAREQLWRQVKQAQKEQRPQDAIAGLEKIYSLAIDDEDFPDAIRAICVECRVEGAIHQPEQPYAIRKLQKRLEELPEQTQPVIKAILADWFLSYYQANRWQFAQRSQTATEPSDDFETWDLQRLLSQIDELLTDGLADAEALKKIAVTDYAELIQEGQISDAHRPTMYDFLAHRAIQFYQMDEQITRPQDNFELTADSPALADRDAFLNWEPETTDNDSALLKAVRLYQDVLRFHIDDDDLTALLDADLLRLAFANRHIPGSEATIRYRAALQRLADANVKHELSSLALAMLAASQQSDDELVKAHAIATTGMKRFPESRGGKTCFNLIQQIEAPMLSVNAETVWNAAGPEVNVTYRNIDRVHFRMVKFDYRNWQWGLAGTPENLSQADRKKFLKRKPAATWTTDLPATDDYKKRTESIAPDVALTPGCYLLIASSDADFREGDNEIISLTHVWISNMAVVTREAHDGNTAGQVVQAIDGRPIAGANVTVYRWQQDGNNSFEVLVGRTRTDEDGLYSVPVDNPNGQRNYQVFIENGDQQLGLINYSFQSRRSSGTNYRTVFFTDRSIYRPGQTIQFKGVCVLSNTDSNKYELMTNQKVVVKLFDVNHESVEEKTFQTNDMGSFSGSFTAPQGRATGQMWLEVSGKPSGQAIFRVEEYKRPKFIVDVATPTEQVRLEQPVSMKVAATAYTGAPIDNAKVVWRVVRNVRYPQWWYWRSWPMPPRGDSQQMANGEGVTDADGSFMVEFTAKPDAKANRDGEPVFSYTVYADVTDSSGETRSSSQTVRVGYTSMKASLAADKWLPVNEPVSLRLTTTTLDDSPTPAKGTLTVYRLTPPAKVQRMSLNGNWRNNDQDNAAAMTDIKAWPIGESVQEQEIECGADGSAMAEITLPAGAFKAVFKSTDESGRPVTAEFPLVVVDPAADKLALKIPNQFMAEQSSLQPGDEFFALWGTGYETGQAYIEIEHRGKVVRSWWTDAGTTQAAIRFPVEEKHRGGFQVRVTFVRDNRVYLTQEKIHVPWSNKELTVKWEHFVSKLTPGGRETWTAVVTGSSAETAAVEMVAAMYDASLDAFAPHAWNNSLHHIFYTDARSVSLQANNQMKNFTTISSHNVTSKAVENGYRDFGSEVVYYPGLWPATWQQNNFKTNLYSRNGRGSWDDAMPGSSLESMSEGMAFAAPVVRFMGTDSDDSDQSNASGTVLMGGIKRQVMGRDNDKRNESNAGAGLNAVDLDQVTARTNLQETAFFFPQLTADSDGRVRIEFEIPEALTKWKFQGFAHDADLRTGLLTDEATTSKDLMVQPNPPRFLREGDQIEFSAKITNRSDKDVTGSVRLTLTDGRTDESLDESFTDKDLTQTFEIPAGQSRPVFWMLSVPDGARVLAYKVVGGTETVSDGEEGFLPVLSKRILVNESLPLPIRGKETKTFTFDRLDMIDSSDSLQSQSLTVQMTSNPSWYAVLSLPYLMEYPHQCNEQVFNRLYANALGQHIVNSSPKIKRVFDQWIAAGDAAALKSPLELNDDIRNAMIAETPWLRDAKDESQARRDVAILFDGNRLANELARATQQLTQRQYSDGSWSWFPGGPASDFITLYITTGFGRLRHLGVEVDTQPAIKSLTRLDGWIQQKYTRLKSEDKLGRNNLSSMISLYLYGRSFFLNDRAISDTNREAVDYFLAQAREHWTSQSRMSQGQLAIALKRFGDNKTPGEIIESVTQRSLTSDEMGRYWHDGEESWWWYRAPIETQSVMIEAYDEVAGDATKVEECKIWLLKQKQTQAWPTTKATADAVYSLLLRGTDSLASSKLVRVKLGDQRIEPEGAEAGTGFYSQKFAGSDVTSAMKTIEVAKSDDGVAWGSVHWQYLQDVGEIEPYEGTPLQLKKSLYIKRNTDDGPVISQVEGPVNVGDELVTRVEIRVDRDMEFVHLKDQRGSGTEPVNVLSKYKRQDGLWYYESTRDTASHFFIDALPRGTYVFEYSVRVQLRGKYETGIASLECMYAPEFNSHSGSVAISVE